MLLLIQSQSLNIAAEYIWFPVRFSFSPYFKLESIISRTCFQTFFQTCLFTYLSPRLYQVNQSNLSIQGSLWWTSEKSKAWEIQPQTSRRGMSDYQYDSPLCLGDRGVSLVLQFTAIKTHAKKSAFR